MAIFGLKIYLFAFNSKSSWCVELKFGHNVGDYKWFMKTEFGVPGHVTKMLEAENGQKVDKFEPIFSYLGNYRPTLMGNDL